MNEENTKGRCPFCGKRMDPNVPFSHEGRIGRQFDCPEHGNFFITDQAETIFLSKLSKEEKTWFGEQIKGIPEKDRPSIDQKFLRDLLASRPSFG